MEIVEGDLGKWRILDRISNEILQGERKKKKKKREKKRKFTGAAGHAGEAAGTQGTGIL